MAQKVRLENVRLAFPVLWHAKKRSEDSDKLAFSASFLMAPNDPNVARVKKAIKAALKEKYKSDEKVAEAEAEILAGGQDRTCLRDGNLKKKYDGFPGHLYLAANNATRPNVFDKDRTLLSEAAGKPYAGCYVDAIVEVFVYTKPRIGVSASLTGVQFVGDGEAFGGSRPAESDDFEDRTQDEEDLS